MASVETEFLREQVQKLREKLKRYEENVFSEHKFPGNLRNDDTVSSSLSEKRNGDFRIGEYDKYSEEMSNHLHLYQAEMAEMRLKLESIIKENETLHEQLKESLETQLESLPSKAALAGEASAEQELIQNLQEQLQLANQERDSALQLWQTVAQEMDRLQVMYQKHMTDVHLHVAERLKQKEELTNLQQFTNQLHGAHEKSEQTNQQFLQTVGDQQMEINQLQKQLRQAKLDVKVGTMKAEEMATVVKSFEEQVKRKEEEVSVARGKEDASDKRVQQLQTAVTQLETRLKAAVQDVEQLKGEKARLEKHLGELQTRYSELEVEKYEAVSRVRDSLQIVEEANLQKDQALLREKQKEEEIHTMKQATAKIIQEAAARTRKEVDNAKKLCNVKISQLTSDISVLQRESAEKQSLTERALRDKRAAEEELEKVYREGRGNEKDYRKLEELQQRCLIAERTKDDLKISLSAVQKKMKQLELNSEEELSRCRETILKLNEVLESERKDSRSVSEERLKLVQENEQLRKDVEEWKKSAAEAQQKLTFQLSTLGHEFLVKEQGFKVQLQEMEDGFRKSIEELMKLLMAQQKASYKWKVETTNLTKSTETRLRKLRSQLNDQKRNNQDLISKLETAHEKNDELENLIADLQEKSTRLQKRLDQAEERSVEASKQLSRVVSQRRKTTHELDLEKI
ncbi:sodium channel and clathrin linker 1 isoform X2 [Bufo gargarizans]|uniref:sodium channel and clathrin linker 1 isoform X2 n=1 Tax=Bufo gargarizans TaxID=30331 RepID=UPI001CF3A129|nr:sodium channel and clathrin linker 1 isoform X2 [Bufo gargarizans]XP_044156986.1 sodium channel and clathrin linker 1 isoform X2 [Bufo gargarizans]